MERRLAAGEEIDLNTVSTPTTFRIHLSRTEHAAAISRLGCSANLLA